MSDTQEPVVSRQIGGTPPEFRLRTFGGLALTCGDRPTHGSGAQPGRIALLAVIARAGHPGISRDKLVGLFWPDSSQDKAKAALRQSLYALRRDAGADLVLGTTDLRLNSAVVSSDVQQFEHALQSGDLAGAAELYTGPFLDGVYLRMVPEFERWAARERAGFAAIYVETLETLASRAVSAGASSDAVRWTRRLAAADAVNSRFALQLMEALARDGQVDAAIRHASAHAALVRAELDVEADASVLAFVRRLQAERATPPDPVPAVDVGGVGARAGAAATLAVEQARGDGDTRPRRRLWTRAKLPLAAAALIVAAASFGRNVRGKAHPTRASRTVSIVPFTVTDNGSPSADLGRTIAGLLADQLRTDSVVDANVGGDGAGEFVRGAVVMSSGRIQLEAAVYDSARRQLAPAVLASAPRDSIESAVARLASQVLAVSAGQRSTRMAFLAARPLPALREYAAGRTLLAEGRYDAAASRFEKALALDSSFVYAALGLATASISDAAGYRQSYDRALELAWNGRAVLPARDRALVEAIAGPQYPAVSSLSERVAAWTRATEAAPESEEAWYGLGDTYLHSGAIAGLSNATTAARVAFERSLEAEPRYLPALQHLVDVSVRLSDTSAARRYATRYLQADSVGAAASYVRWRLASLTGDWRKTPSFEGAPLLATRWFIEIAPFDALGLGQAGDAIAARDRRADASVADRVETALARHTLALNQGRPRQAARIRDELALLEPTDTMDIRLPILAALYGDGDADAGETAARDLTVLYELERIARGEIPLPPVGAAGDNRTEALCIVGQWRAMHHDSAFAVMASRVLDSAKDAHPRLRNESVWCAAILRSMSAAVPSLATLDSLDALIASGANLRRSGLLAAQATAREYMRAGRPDKALQSARRRGYFGRWPYYLATSLREEARFALAAGDSVGAACALDRYLALRAAPDAGIAPAVAAAASERAHLSLGRRGKGCPL